MKIKDIQIHEDESIKNILKKLDTTHEKVLLVVDKDERLLGTITDGDIRRFVLNGGSLENNIANVYNRKPIYVKQKDLSMDSIKALLLKHKLILLPILDDRDRTIDFITWSEAFSDSEIPMRVHGKIDVPVVIMSGGKSTRLEPFTRILPKSLIPIGEKPIIEIIIDEFKKQGANEYYLVLNYKGEIIESYFDNIKKDYNVYYVREKDFLGTSGGLKLLEDKIKDIFIVSNCDVIIKANFEEVINAHREKSAWLTIFSSFQHYEIPYGIIKLEKEGKVADITEKPEYTFMANAGVYILNKECLKYIPNETNFDMTDLIKTLIKDKRLVLTYPVNEKDYLDIGQWTEYKKAIERMHL